MLYDTTFLIDLAGNRSKAGRERALAFLRAWQDQPVYTSRVCWAEFAEGCDTEQMVDAQIGPWFNVLEINKAVAWRASWVSRTLMRTGKHIGDNDIWAAATAMTYGLPLVTRNTDHFKRVAGLQVETY